MDIRNKDIFKNQLIMNLLENIGVDTNQLSCKTDFIIIKDYGQKIYVIDNIRNAEPTQMTELGNASLRYDLDELFSLGLSAELYTIFMPIVEE